MSALVPPTSIEITSAKPAARAMLTAPITPAAGPESTVCTGWRTHVGALVTPPSDFMMSSGAFTPMASRAPRSTPTYRLTGGMTAALSAVAMVRSNSRNCGSTSDDKDTNAPGYSSARMACIRCSCTGLA